MSNRPTARLALQTLVAIAFFGIFAWLPSPAQAQFTVHYTAPPAALQELSQAVAESGIAELAADYVNGSLDLGAEVPIVFETCGQANAFYNPEHVRISFCYEFLGMFAQIFASDPNQSEEAIGDNILGSTLFFLLHEMGHAMVHVLELPITGREEDAVDDLAALVLIDAEGHDDLLSAAESFDAMAALLESSGAEMAFWGEHSLSAQRAYSLACIVYGADPEAYSDLVHPELLPEQRAVRCPAEFEQKASSWERLLEPYYVQ